MSEKMKVTLDQEFGATIIRVYKPERQNSLKKYSVIGNPRICDDTGPRWNTPAGARRLLRGYRLFSACLKKDWAEQAKADAPREASF